MMFLEAFLIRAMTNVVVLSMQNHVPGDEMMQMIR
jgi:hypothetical protein